MTSGRRIITATLLLIAAGSGLWVWHLRRDAEPPQLVGPPRSDYLLFDFDLIALDTAGKESFAASGPRLTRHPHLGTLDIDTPLFTSPDDAGETWTSTATHAWVNGEGTELRLLGNAQVRGPATAEAEPILLRSETLVLFPRERQVRSDVAVTVTEPGSILTAIGLRGDLNARRVELLSDVRIHHAAVSP